jgi:VWFA-related protein
MRNLLSAMFVAAAAGLVSLPALAAPPADSNGSNRPVVLPVTVRDKKGGLVESLQKGDLTLTVDKRPQTIVSLSRAGDQSLRIGLVVDTSKAMSNALEAERQAADKFIDAELPAGTKNQLFLIHFDREVELLEDFTGSAEKLHREIDGMSATQQERYDSTGPETTGDERESTPRGRKGTQLYDAIFLACDELMKNKDGRKLLVVISNGADRGSKDTLNDAIDAADRAGVSVYTIFMKGADLRETGQQNSGDHRRGGSGWPGGGGGGYPGGGGGYPGGGGGNRKQPEPRASNGADGKKIMEEMSTRTGAHGYEAKKREDLDAIYGLIEQELKSQYLLSYTPDKADKDAGFHKVSVSAGNKDYSVTAPEGFYVPEK